MQTQALIERDAQAYHEASAALARDERSAPPGRGLTRPRRAGAGRDRERLLGEALTHAADLALAIADAACEIAQLAADVARHARSR